MSEVITGIVGVPQSGKTYWLTRDAMRARYPFVRVGIGPFAVLRPRRNVHRVVANFELGRRVRAHVVDRRQLVDHGWPALLEGDHLTLVPCRCTRPRRGHVVRAFVPFETIEYIRTLEDLLHVRARRDRWTREPIEYVDVYLDETQIALSSRRSATASFWSSDAGVALIAYISQVRHAGLRVKWAAQHELETDVIVRRKTGLILTARRFRFFGRTLFLFKPWAAGKVGDADESKHATAFGLEVHWLRRSIAEAFETHADVMMGMENAPARVGRKVPQADTGYGRRGQGRPQAAAQRLP